jgi:hypothetical protein
VKVGHRYLDDPAGGNDQYQVKLRWRDQFGGANSAVLTTTVRNDAPDLGAITASLPPLVVGQPITLRGVVWDQGTQDALVLHVRWTANGPWQKVHLPAGTTNFTLRHTYAAAGRHQVTLLVVDDDLEFDQQSLVLDVTS